MQALGGTTAVDIASNLIAPLAHQTGLRDRGPGKMDSKSNLLMDQETSPELAKDNAIFIIWHLTIAARYITLCIYDVIL